MHVHYRSVTDVSWSARAAGHGWPDGQAPAWFTDKVAEHLAKGGKVRVGTNIYWWAGLFRPGDSRGGEPRGKTPSWESIEARPKVDQLSLFDVDSSSTAG